MRTTKYIRRPVYVDAVRVTNGNITEVAKWCGGEVKTFGNDGTKVYILVDVPRAYNQRQREAYVGDWVLKTDSGFKVYTDVAFKKNFRETVGQSRKKSPRGPVVSRELVEDTKIDPAAALLHNIFEKPNPEAA